MKMPSRVQQHFHRQGSGLRNELTDYDESLLLDRSIVHTPAEGWAAVAYLQHDFHGSFRRSVMQTIATVL